MSLTPTVSPSNKLPCTHVNFLAAPLAVISISNTSSSPTPKKPANLSVPRVVYNRKKERRVEVDNWGSTVETKRDSWCAEASGREA